MVDHSNLNDPLKTFNRQYAYDGQEMFLEFDGNSNLLARYTHSTLRTDDVLDVDVTPDGVAQKIGAATGTYIFLKDQLGTIEAVADSGGMIVQKYAYSAYGILLGIRDMNGVDVSAGPIVTMHFGFTGREFDRETGLYYYRARYYDPNIGRFLQQDLHPGRIVEPPTVSNRYLYVVNNPINLTDPTGRDFWKDALKVVVIIAAVVAAVYLGPLAAGALGLSGGWAAAGSVIFGAAAGGFVGGAGYASLGLGSFKEGFTVGAIAGALGGFGGYYSSAVAGGNVVGYYNGIAGVADILQATPIIAPTKFLSFSAVRVGVAILASGISLYNTGRVIANGPEECESYDVYGDPFGFTSSCH